MKQIRELIKFLTSNICNNNYSPNANLIYPMGKLSISINKKFLPGLAKNILSDRFGRYVIKTDLMSL